MSKVLNSDIITIPDQLNTLNLLKHIIKKALINFPNFAGIRRRDQSQ